MPRPMLKTQSISQNEQQASLTSLTLAEKNLSGKSKLDKFNLERLLRRKRSERYLKAMRQLDAGGHVQNQRQVEQILGAIAEEFSEVGIPSELLGIVSICYLGAPYEVHSLDMLGNIIEHYKAGEKMPGGLEKAHSIALHGGYAFIEVYSDCCRAISEDGSVAVIAG